MSDLHPSLSNPFEHAPITIVSGLPRSGTSMMMKMLAAGGLPVVTDHLRTADESNPEGYFELEAVKKLQEGDFAFLAEAGGGAVKIISALLEYLPPVYPYRVILMRRNLAEILASQKKMLAASGQAAAPQPDEKMAGLYQKHLAQVNFWLRRHSKIQWIEISYNQLLQNPTPEIERVVTFLGQPLNTERMAACINTDLYRQREAGPIVEPGKSRALNAHDR
jgi:hypothetical protein